jgi:hypothetical protein
VKLKSKQEEIFEVEKEVACRSVTVKNMVDDTGLDTPVPLPMVDSKILIKVIEYCKYHRTRHRAAPPPSRHTLARACSVHASSRRAQALRIAALVRARWPTSHAADACDARAATPRAPP